MKSVNANYLLQGAVFTLEQCGLLLRDARILCEAGSYASAVVLAAFAREVLGRYSILRRLCSVQWPERALALNRLANGATIMSRSNGRGCSAWFSEPTLVPGWVSYCRLDRARHLEALNGKISLKRSIKSPSRKESEHPATVTNGE